MKKIIYSLILISFITLFSGCLVSERIEYSINLDTPTSGNVEVNLFNIKSDAIGAREFEDDKKNLFEFALKDKNLVIQLGTEGKFLTHRSLSVENNQLNAKVFYNFKDITKVDGIRFEDGFYYLTMALDDSLISTNGELIISKEYKRILWDKNYKQLKFEMYSSGFDNNTFKGLASFYNKN
ncbi:MAG: hypothetical protein CO128_04665 [Ignavibacteriales bacterium CG_4_9_14_3_um_filter_30_11]|nr:MAG: hypothetical protein CO128_04665 [Ignavibacteriales bacterium CG_4_9_14_3_um_filter_30_11]